MDDVNVFDQMEVVKDDSGSEFDYVVIPEFAKKYPQLNALLFARQSYGKPREPGKISIFIQEGAVKVCLVSPTEGLCAFSTVKQLEGMWLVLEDRLRKGKLEWRKDKKHGRSR